MDIKEKIELLKSSLAADSVSKEEYESQLKSLEEELSKEGHGKKIPDEEAEMPKSSDKSLIFGIMAIIVLFIAVFGFVYFVKEKPKTVDELHLDNINNDIDPEHGYMYNGIYSFVEIDGFWYTQLKSPKGKKLYDFSLRYSPRELENITINGYLNATLFDESREYYVTFNPLGEGFSHVALAAGDFNQHMVTAFEKTPIAACDKNETEVCKTRPIVNCSSTSKAVFYIRESNISRAYYDNNCIVVEGKGFELVRMTDRILYNLYGIMEQRISKLGKANVGQK